MRMTVIHREQPGITYAADAFARHIGTEIPISTPGYQGKGILVDAHVSEDGGSVQFTVDVDERAMRSVDRVRMELAEPGCEYHDVSTFGEEPGTCLIRGRYGA